MQEKVHYLYKITNLVNGKLYIGVTNNPKHRQRCHLSYRHEGRLVNKAVEKYGKENLVFEIICIGSKEYIYNLESKAIISYNSDATHGHGYNICSGGVVNSGNIGHTFSKRSDDKPNYVAGFWFPNKRIALKSLNWGVGKYNSRKKKGILGQVQTKERKHGLQRETYVSGFWFNSKSQALKVLNLSPNVYEALRKEGSLGEVKRRSRKSHSTVLENPTYFKGFWFPSVREASKLLSISPTAIRQRILRGRFEENSKALGEAPKRQYYILGGVFKTLKDAEQVLGIPETTIKNRISQNKPSYGHIYTTQ